MEDLTEGRIVHYVLPHGSSAGEHRPAIIVKVWGSGYSYPDGTVNLQVFTDGMNDGENYAQPPLWMTSVLHDPNGAPDTWHWIEKA